MNSSKTGLIIAAAFIGPGTVTTASIAGAQLGYGLFWALIFSIFATYILQEMASRLGLITHKGLSENLASLMLPKPVKLGLLVLVICALGIGNAAYEGGNISGAALGISSVVPGSLPQWVAILGISALALIWSNSYRIIEFCLVSLVAVMSLVFMLVMMIAGFNLEAIMAGIRADALFSDTTLLLAIIGTTIVPYNLFLHASLSAKQASLEKALGQKAAYDSQDLRKHKKAMFSSIGIGGLVTFAIMSCAVNAFFLTQTTIDKQNIANQLTPLLGANANVFFALGLFAAGLTSAITAPLATAYAICGLFNIKPSLDKLTFKLICSLVIIIGMGIALSGYKPFSIILIAQASNAILLPISAIILLVLMNQRKVMATHTNSVTNNVLACIVIAVVMGLAITKLI